VGNLPRSVADTVPTNFVVNAGFQVGSASVIGGKFTGQLRGFGFVELTEGEDLEPATQGSNGQTLEGRRLTVNAARPLRTDPPTPAAGRHWRASARPRQRLLNERGNL